MPNWFPIALIIVLIGLLAIAIFLAWRAPAEGLDQNHTDPVPVRLGVIVLGAVVIACVIGLITIVDDPPEVAQSPVVEKITEETSPAGGATDGRETTISTTGTDTAAADAANLGLSGQIVGIFGTIAAGAVGGIAGLLTAQRRT